MTSRSLSLRRGFDEQSRQTVLFLELDLSWRGPICGVTRSTICPELSSITSFRDEGAPVIVLEDFEGVSLSSLVERQTLPQSDALTILRKVATALDHLHAAKQTHGAVRPSSIMVSPENEVRVFDWMVGWKDQPAEFLAEAAEYLSPERLSNAPEGPRADQFTLGTIAHELLLGRAAFPADGLAEKLFRIRHGLWDDGVMGEIGLSSYRVYDRVFSVKPEDRFDSCTAFVDELENASRQRSYSETKLVEIRDPGSLPTRLSEQAKPAQVSRLQPRASVTGWWIAAAVAALVAFAMGLLNSRMQNQIDESENQAETLAGAAPATVDISHNGVFSVCNPSPVAVDIGELAVAYWGEDHTLKVFNSTQYTREGWKVAPASSQLLSWPLGEKTVWDGSVLLYFVRVRQGQKEYVVSGRWGRNEQGCLRLSS